MHHNYLLLLLLQIVNIEYLACKSQPIAGGHVEHVRIHAHPVHLLGAREDTRSKRELVSSDDEAADSSDDGWSDRVLLLLGIYERDPREVDGFTWQTTDADTPIQMESITISAEAETRMFDELDLILTEADIADVWESHHQLPEEAELDLYLSDY
jgi:hypothetical protein